MYRRWQNETLPVGKKTHQLAVNFSLTISVNVYIAKMAGERDREGLGV